MDLLNIFRQNIDLDTYKQMLREVFKADVLLDNSHIEELPAITDDDKGYYIGNKRTSDRYNIGFFYYEIGRSNVARKKVGLRNLVHKFINSRDGQFDAALVAFKDANHWRLSFICDIQDEATAPKRFTFVFGDADSLYRTPIERFGKLQQKGLNKKNIQDAFSVEALNDQFFDDYKAHYEAFVEFITGKRFVKEGGKWVEKVIHDPHPTIYPQFKCDDKSVRDYVKQMMGRIVFLHFLQKKGWMGVPADAETWEGGDQNFMFKLFQYATPAQKNNFLDTVLEPLFFECLNTERERDIYVTPIEAIGKVRIPYLNGELFEKTELDKTECKFDVKLFEDLFNLFNSYNFTIDENDPSDAEIGVDPEMLGKIFENLLEDNKDKGAFYTPKEIVSYMCKESLIAYLQSKFGKAHHDSIRTLVSTHLKDQHLEEDQNVCERLNKALRDVKVCDPAIGSGAFPMGLLNDIFACRCQLETSDKSKDELKGEIIQNNIYGVDIERGAVDIARLRFWLALVVDAEKPVPLPNLDYKIMQGNSLLESYKGQDLTKFMENAFAQPYAIQLNKDLKKYFKETNNTEKLKLRKNIDYTIKQCIFQCGIQDDIELPNTEFFLWHTYFKDVFDEGGFDIVIGNPPYFVYEGHHTDEIESIRNNPEFESALGGKLNAYKVFLAKATQILANTNGFVSFIFQNSFLADSQATLLRKDILENHSIICIDSFPERDNKKKRVFESAKMSVCILLLQMRKEDSSFCVNFWKDRYMSDGLTTHFTTPEIALIDSEMMSIPRLDENNIPLVIKIKNVPNRTFIKCYQGELNMTTHRGYFTIDESKPKVLKGASIQRYYWTEEMSQGIVEHVDDLRYISDFPNSEKAQHHNCIRIGMQGMTGANDKIRIVSCIIEPGLYLAHSCNYIIAPNNLDLYYLLGVLNSKVVNWYFKCFSTNSNVNSYEIESTPIPNANNIVQASICSLVQNAIKEKYKNNSSITEENGIDFLVFHLYGLTYDEVKIIYGDEEPPFSREKYDAYKPEE